MRRLDQSGFSDRRCKRLTLLVCLRTECLVHARVNALWVLVRGPWASLLVLVPELVLEWSNNGLR